ncbi:caspase family protein [Kitasatospora kifunensis]|uniref:Peptidase C14 caspase domain-containing protein n=1 Tax=Kitasatospora kifunensis TaxID=58351 RepID=A0A7W7VT97_KITKI|nr:caspase family protein [Kitasatospora kifunensis]MBB4921987.1 hypothetical protein [Kitasatospora kifunensis]
MSEGPRRHLIAAGTAKYRDEEIEELPQVPEDLEKFAAIFGSMRYEPALQLLDLDRDALRGRLVEWKNAARREGDALVLYFSGHGERTEDGHHYLLCHDSEFGQPDLAFGTEELVAILGRRCVRHLLIVIDTCYAGLGAAQSVRRLSQDLTHRLAGSSDADSLVSFAVIAAARSREQAEDGLFTRALAQAVNDPSLGGSRQERLALELLVGRINEQLAAAGTPQRAEYYMSGDGTFAFLPNPRYEPALPLVVDLAEQRAWLSWIVRPEHLRRDDHGEEAVGHALASAPQPGQSSSYGGLREDELVGHFGPRGRGSESTLPYDYFTGRALALDVLTSWMAGRTEHREHAVVVTGSPGVGKSALLSRLVLGNVIDVPIHARHRSLADLVNRFAEHLGAPELRSPEEVLAALSARRSPLSVLVDGLDEAVESEAQAIATALLRPLAGLPNVLLLVGTRRHLVELLGTGFWSLDLDEPRWLGASDLAVYAHLLLSKPDGPGSQGPYWGADGRTVARAIAECSDGNYLATRLIARTLAYRPMSLDTTQPDWQRVLPTGPPGAVFSWALREQLGADEHRGRALLTPIAFAEGSGLPWTTVWPALAAAVLGRPVDGPEFARLVDLLGPYLTEGLDHHGRSVYRVYHESFADELRAAAPPDTQERLARALIDLVPTAEDGKGPDWAAADPYIRAHLATHAAAGGELDELATDPLFLLTMHQATLLPALDTLRSASAVAVRQAYQTCSAMFPDLQQLGERAAQLELAAVQQKATDLAAAIRARVPERPWSTRWARGNRSYRTIGSFGSAVVDVVERVLDGRTVVVTAEVCGVVRVWDFVTGAALGSPLAEVPVPVRQLAVPEDSDAAVVLVLAGGTARIWDLRTANPVSEPYRTPATRAALAASDRLIGLLVGDDGETDVVDLVGGLLIARIATDLSTMNHPLVPGPLTITAHAGQATVAIAANKLSGRRGRSATLGVWAVDLQNGQATRTTHRQFQACLILDLHPSFRGVDAALSQPTYRRMGVRIAQRGQVRIFRSRTGERSASLTARAGETFCWFGSTHKLKSWDSSGQLSHFVDAGFGTIFRLVALASTALPAVLTIESNSRTVKVWQPGANSGHREAQDSWPDLHSDAMTLITLDGQPRLIQGRVTDSRLRTIDPASGTVSVRRSRSGLVGQLATHQDIAPVLVSFRSVLGRRRVHLYGYGKSGRSAWLTGDSGDFVENAVLVNWDAGPVLVCLYYDRIDLWDDHQQLVARLARPCARSGIHESFAALGQAERLLLAVAGKASVSVVEYRGSRATTVIHHQPAVEGRFDLVLWNEYPVLCYVRYDGSLVAVEATDGRVLASWPEGGRSQVTEITGSRLDDRLVLVTASVDEVVRVWDSGSPGCLHSVRVGSRITGLALVDERHVAIASSSGVMCLRLL